ncbi:MAG TPA: class I SAM-dependent methyltransferase [Gaiellaceae bacterium]|nr:class I SAM-dependent methyltransferase [Gaiellaceae bacterium]
MSSSDAERNRAFWDARADEYQETHREHIGRPEPRWGIWQLPERELQVLGDVAGKDVLELGCGAAQWSILLAAQGARCVGLDNSERQLAHARAAGAGFPLVHGSAESLPFADGSFDLVFCDHGAMSFADPRLVVPEVARVLRGGGLFAFSITSSLAWICWDDETDGVVPELRADYFGLHRHEGSHGSVSFQLPVGEWIRLFRANGLVVEDLIEPQPPGDATTTYGFDLAWARRWPLEQIWKARKP